MYELVHCICMYMYLDAHADLLIERLLSQLVSIIVCKLGVQAS